MANDKRHPDDTLSEEASALGERMKGAAKDGLGSVTGNRRLEREGELENAEGRARQRSNDVLEETDGVRGATVGYGGSRDLDLDAAHSSHSAEARDRSFGEDTSGLAGRISGSDIDRTGTLAGNEHLVGERHISSGDEIFNSTVAEPPAMTSSRMTEQPGDPAFDRDRDSSSRKARATSPDDPSADQSVGSVLGLGGVVAGDSSRDSEFRQPDRDGDRHRPSVDVDANRSGWSDQHFVTGLYDSPDTARTAYHDLTTRHGYADDDISVLMTDETRRRHFGDAKPGTEFKEGTKAAEGAGIGGGIGLGVGAALGALVAAATAISIPGLGLVVAGPIAGAIAGAGAGSATGGILGALIGAGIPETRAVEYERGLKEGGIVLGTRARDEAHASELQRNFSGHGARNVLR